MPGFHALWQSPRCYKHGETISRASSTARKKKHSRASSAVKQKFPLYFKRSETLPLYQPFIHSEKVPGDTRDVRQSHVFQGQCESFKFFRASSTVVNAAKASAKHCRASSTLKILPCFKHGKKKFPSLPCFPCFKLVTNIHMLQARWKIYSKLVGMGGNNDFHLVYPGKNWCQQLS